MGGIRLYVLLILAMLLSGLAAMLPFAWSGSGVLSSSYRESSVKEMEASARLLSLAVPSEPGRMPRERLRELVKEARAATGSRFTVVQTDGTVAADSDEDADRMENHLNRAEIQAALSGKTGIEVRPSPTLDSDWIYVAVPLADGSVVRAAESLSALNKRLALWWKKALAGFAVSAAVLLGLAILAARKIAKPIEDAAAGAEHFARGDFGYRLPATGSAETRRLSYSMGTMAEELDARFTTITRQKEKMRVVFDNMSEGVLAVDDNGKVMLVNGAAERMFGLSTNVSGVGIETVARNADLLDIIRETVSSGSPVEKDIRVRHGEEESLVQVHTVRITDDDGGSKGVLAVLRDVTRLRYLEQMRRDFIANVSHELRTPITAVRSCLETLLEDGIDDKKEETEFLDMALRNTRRIGSIIDNSLFLAGMEAGDNSETGKVGNHLVRPVLDESVSLCREQASGRRITVSVDCPDDLSARMNPSLVVHAIVNLLDNAIKYGPEEGAVDITAFRDGDKVRISVSDQGPGIPPRFQSRVFERFYRVDGSARMKKGSGLGLAIVKHIVSSQGGDIYVESEIGSGSKFIISLPLPSGRASTAGQEDGQP